MTALGQRITRSASFLILSLIAAACGIGHNESTVPVKGRSATVSLALQPYFRELKTVKVTAGQEDLTMLLDTGGGATLVTPQVAERAGLQSFGRDIGHRMTGEAVEYKQCEGLELVAGAWKRRVEPLAVFDINALLPPELPKLDGVLALDAFRGEVVTFDWPAGILTVHANKEADSALQKHGVPARIATGETGRFYDAFLPVSASKGTLWFLLDSGNIDSTLVAKHVVRDSLLEMSPEGNVQLQIGTRPTFTIAARIADLAIDGALGTAFLMRGPLTLDLR